MDYFLLFVYTFVKTLDLTGTERAPFRSGYYLLAGWGIGAILLAIFPTDVPPVPVSWHGAIHLTVAIVAFICGGVGTFTLARHFDESAPLKRVGKLSKMLSSLSLLLLLVELFGQFLVPHLSSNIGGLVERLFLGSVLLWMFVVSIYLISQRSLLNVRSETVSANK